MLISICKLTLWKVFRPEQVALHGITARVALVSRVALVALVAWVALVSRHG